MPIREQHCPFVHFTYYIQYCQYCALPFGMKLPPRMFTKILVTLIAHFRLQGVSLFPYMDDILVKVLSPDLCATALTIH